MLITIAVVLGGLWFLLEEKTEEVIVGMLTNPHGILLPSKTMDLDLPDQFTHTKTELNRWDPKVARWCSDAVLRLEIAAKNEKPLLNPPHTKIYKQLTDIEYAPGKKIFMTFLTTDFNQNLLILVIRGTLTEDEWDQDLRLSMVPAKFLGADGDDYYKDVMIHNGFNTIYSEMRDSVLSIVKGFSNNPFTFIVTGHSLGAAMTVLSSADMTYNVPNVERTLAYVYGCPRVGNAAFADLVKSQNNLTIHRVENNSDFFTEVPTSITPNLSNFKSPFPYTHVGDVHSFNINHFSILANHNLPIYNLWLDSLIKYKVPDSEQHK